MRTASCTKKSPSQKLPPSLANASFTRTRAGPGLWIAEASAAGEFFHGSLPSVDCCGVERRPGVFGAWVDVERRRIDETEIPRRPTVVRQTRLGRADET